MHLQGLQSIHIQQSEAPSLLHDVRASAAPEVLETKELNLTCEKGRNILNTSNFKD